MSRLNARLEGFARQQLALGKGEWWIVHEMVRLGHVDQAAAKEIVERVWPGVFETFIRHRRRYFRAGAYSLAIPVLSGLLPFLSWGNDYGERSFSTWVQLMFNPFSVVAMVVGIALVAFGWSGLKYRPPAGSAPGLPGSDQIGPVRTGLAWRAHPFEWK